MDRCLQDVLQLNAQHQQMKEACGGYLTSTPLTSGATVAWQTSTQATRPVARLRLASRMHVTFHISPWFAVALRL